MGDMADDLHYHAMLELAARDQYRNKIDSVAAQLVERLKAKGFIIQRYDSYSTCSVYLKLDYGMCNSIRISDHAGKKHLAYRYNMIRGSSKYIDKSGQYERRFYPLNAMNEVIKDILEQRSEKIEAYGEKFYQKMAEKSARENADNKGFWQSAQLV